MKKLRPKKSGLSPIVIVAVCLISWVNVAGQKREHISATATGTNQQLGKMISVDLRIFEYSVPDDQKALIEAFTENGSEGLANALDKMKAKGRIAITGTLGFDVNYIRQIRMPDGSRRIRFVTDRPILFGEAWGSRRSMDYQISMGEIIISKTKGKSTGTLMPATKVKLNKDNELEIETFQNPWRLTNIRVY